MRQRIATILRELADRVELRGYPYRTRLANVAYAAAMDLNLPYEVAEFIGASVGGDKTNFMAARDALDRWDSLRRRFDQARTKEASNDA